MIQCSVNKNLYRKTLRKDKQNEQNYEFTGHFPESGKKRKSSGYGFSCQWVSV